MEQIYDLNCRNRRHQTKIFRTNHNAKGKKVDEFVKEILDDYLRRNVVENEEINEMMKLSELSFNEWENEEDAVYSVNA